MFPGLYGSTREADDQDVLPIKIEVHAKQCCDFILALLAPESLLPMIDPVCTVVERVCEDLFVDFAQVLDLRLLLNVKHHLFVLKDSDREVIGAHYQLLLAIIVPIHKLDGGGIVTGDRPETFIGRDIETCDATVSRGDNQGLTNRCESPESQTVDPIRDFFVEDVFVQFDVIGEKVRSRAYKEHLVNAHGV